MAILNKTVTAFTNSAAMAEYGSPKCHVTANNQKESSKVVKPFDQIYLFIFFNFYIYTSFNNNNFRVHQ